MTYSSLTLSMKRNGFCEGLRRCIGEKGLEERKLIDTNGNSIGEMKIKDSDGGA